MHLSLKGSMDRQPLTDRLGDRLLAEYGGAAAAYSLRALNGNGDSVVRVRRASDNDEEDFTAEQIELGEMVNWVNSQTVPPLDIGVETSEGRIPVPEGGTSIGIPAAAYSLRNLSTTYTGNVVDVRRSSDDAEDSFTAAEVADGTLTDWVSEDTTQYMQFDGVDEDISTPALLPATDDFTFTIKFILDEVPASTMGLYGSLSSGSSGRHVFQINTSGQAFAFISGVAALTTANSINVGAINTFVLSRSGTNWSLSLNGGTADTATGSIALDTAGSNIGDPYSGINFNGIITSLSVGTITWDGSAADATAKGWTVNGSPTSTLLNDGFVSKWYDQSGNDNHATQGTNASQPKIVVGGSLVTNNGNAVVNFQSIDDRHFIFGAGIDLTARTVFYAGRPASTNFQNLLGNTSNSSTNYIRTLNNVAGRPWETEPSSSIFVDGSAYAGGDVSDQGYSLNTFVFDSDATVNFLGGTGAAISDTPIVDASEIILYPSDQSDNRTAIEANIGETYGITGIPAYDNTVDGFVETWYDQSGNGNDATQSVAASQPKIVDAGVLVSGGIDFDGVDDVLGTSLVPPNAATLIGVANWDVEDQTSMIIGARDSTNQRSYISQASSGKSAIGVSSSALASGIDIVAGDDYLLFGVHSGSTRLLSTNGSVISDSGGSAPNNTIQGYSVGAFNTAGTNDSFMDGTLAEVIVYNSDQSANRVAIETNINDHYNIY
jgi:hypothetical protein